MSVLFIESGILTIFQDAGRHGYRRFGINPNGVMDRTAARLINILIGNEENEAVLEMHYPAPAILFEKETVFALGGADFDAVLNDKKIDNWRLYTANAGDSLLFRDKISGNRCYLTINNKFEIKRWLNSHSTNLTAESGGYHGRKISNGDRIFYNQRSNPIAPKKNLQIARSLLPRYDKSPIVRAIPGAEFELLTAVSEINFLRQFYTVGTNSNRMGFSLRGEPLYLLDPKEMLSSAVTFGTIQLPPDGQPLILMADHQTTGGYPQIAHVIETDLPTVAQLGANDKIKFRLVSFEEAEKTFLDYEKEINIFRVGCSLHR